MTAGDRLRATVHQLAAKRGWSVNFVADRAGLSRSYLSAVLRGEKSPTLRTVDKIAMALEVDVAQLFIYTDRARD